jgi:hypothetical protein
LVVLDGGSFVVGQWDRREHPGQAAVRLQRLGFGGFFGFVEVAAGAGHPVRTLFEEGVGAPAVAQVVVLPGLAAGGGAGGDGVAVEEDLDGADVAGEVASVGVGPGLPCFFRIAD